LSSKSKSNNPFIHLHTKILRRPSVKSTTTTRKKRYNNQNSPISLISTITELVFNDQSIGWIEQEKSKASNPESITTLLGLKTYEKYVEEYGEENARYMMESLGGGLNQYSKFAYIDTKIGNQSHYKDRVKRDALENGWNYEEIEGDTNLLLKMMNGAWDDHDFLVIEPGSTIEPSYDSDIIKIDNNK